MLAQLHSRTVTLPSRLKGTNVKDIFDEKSVAAPIVLTPVLGQKQEQADQTILIVLRPQAAGFHLSGELSQQFQPTVEVGVGFENVKQSKDVFTRRFPGEELLENSCRLRIRFLQLQDQPGQIFLRRRWNKVDEFCGVGIICGQHR